MLLSVLAQQKSRWLNGCCVENTTVDSQLEQGEVGVAIVRLLFALLHHVVLQNGGGLGVVAVQAVEDVVNVLRPVRHRIFLCLLWRMLQRRSWAKEIKCMRRRQNLGRSTAQIA